MIKIGKKDYIKEIRKIPSKSGVVLFESDKEILLIKKSSNLNKLVGAIFEAGKEDKDIFQLLSITESIRIVETADIFTALVEEKILLDRYTPTRQNIIMTGKNYVYLGINFYSVPYLKICEDTQENLYYLGPFFDRFFLHDFMDAMGNYFGFPRCENEDYPCDRLKNKICRGYCVMDIADYQSMIKENYLSVNLALEEELNIEIEEKLDNLDFNYAEKLKSYRSIIIRYYDYLRFLYATKSLNNEFNFNNNKIKIKNGIIHTIQTEGKTIYSNYIIPEYRKNEILSIDKSFLADAWIVYNYINKIDPEKIERIFNNTHYSIMKDWSDK